jgi:MFS family permease
MVVVPLTEGRDLGWPAWLLALLALSPVMAVVSIRYQRWRAANRGMPLMDLTLFRERSFTGGVFLAGLSQVTNAGLFFIIAVYLQTGRDLSPGLAGLVFAPLGAGYMSIAFFAPRMLHRLGRKTIAIGYFIVAMAIGSVIAVLSIGGPHASPFTLVPSIYLIGAGQGFVNSPLFAVALSRVRPGQEGSASGLITTLQQTGASIGVAIEGLVFFSALGAAAGAIHVSPTLGAHAFERALWVNLSIDLLAVVCVRLLPAGHSILPSRPVVEPTPIPAVASDRLVDRDIPGAAVARG